MILLSIFRYYLLKTVLPFKFFFTLFLFLIIFKKKTGIKNRKENFRNCTKTGTDNFYRTGRLQIMYIHYLKHENSYK